MSFLKAVKQNPNLKFITIKDNVSYTTVKELKQTEQIYIDEYNSINSEFGLNCIRAYRCPELTYNYKLESDIKLVHKNPINRFFRTFISNQQEYLCKILNIQNQKFNKNSKHSLKKQQIDIIIDKLESDMLLYWPEFIIFYLNIKIQNCMVLKL